MDTFSQHLLNETYKNLFLKDTDLRKQYVDEVWEILQISYKKMGGIKGSGFQNKEDMIKKIPFWKLSVRDGKVQALAMYKDKKGRKRVAIGTNRTEQGKSDLADLLTSEYKTGRAFGEVSGPSLRFIQSLYSEKELKKFTIPFDVVKKMMPDDEFKQIDKYSYERMIGGEWHEKLMLGNPNAKGIS